MHDAWPIVGATENRRDAKPDGMLGSRAGGMVDVMLGHQLDAAE